MYQALSGRLLVRAMIYMTYTVYGLPKNKYELMQKKPFFQRGVYSSSIHMLDRKH